MHLKTLAAAASIVALASLPLVAVAQCGQPMEHRMADGYAPPPGLTGPAREYSAAVAPSLSPVPPSGVGSSDRGFVRSLSDDQGQGGHQDSGGEDHGGHMTWMPVTMVVMMVAMVAVGGVVMGSRRRGTSNASVPLTSLSPAASALPVSSRSGL